MFGIFLPIAGTVMLAYLLWRAAAVPFVARRVPRFAVLLLGAALAALMFLARTLGHGRGGAVANALDLAGLVLLTTLFLCVTCLLPVDLVTCIPRGLRKRAPALRGHAMLLGLALAGLALVQGHRPPAIVDETVRLRGLPAALDGTVVVVLSDLHLGSTLDADWLAARVDQVQGQGDVVVLLGDIVEGHGEPPEEFLPALRRLSAPLGVFAVTGNHESHGRGEGAARMLADAGVRVLHDEWAELRPGLVVAGIDDVTYVEEGDAAAAKAMRAAMAGRPEGATILLSHAPVGAAHAAREGAALMLSGHTHGGQVWPFGAVVRTRFPFVSGRHEVEGMPLIVCRGTGTWGPRMRLWRRSEILRITLRA